MPPSWSKTGSLPRTQSSVGFPSGSGRLIRALSIPTASSSIVSPASSIKRRKRVSTNDNHNLSVKRG